MNTLTHHQEAYLWMRCLTLGAKTEKKKRKCVEVELNGDRLFFNCGCVSSCFFLRGLWGSSGLRLPFPPLGDGNAGGVPDRKRRHHLASHHLAGRPQPVR